MADNLTTATIDVRANTRGMERDILKALQTVELSQINTKKSSQALGRITGQVSEFNKSLEASNARVVAFGASAGAIFAVEKALSSLISSTINVQKQLADVNVLLNLSSSSLEKFGSSLFDIARNTAQSFSEVATAATELSRQGLGVEETLKRTNAALILTRLSGLDAKSSVEALTATLNSFSGSALDAVEVVNKLANVDAAFAVSSADLANAISRVGSTAVDAGVSLDELIALVTSAQQTTARGGAVIGNSFKTIFTRLQRGKVQDLLGSLGVDTGEGQSAISLLQQLASTYDTLGASQKSYVAEQVGGVFQINILKAALSDLGKEYSIYGRALDTSLSSTDEAIRRNELLNKTVSALSSQTVASLEQAANKIGSIVFEPNAKGFLSGFNNLLESFNNIDAESAGGKLMTGFFKGIGDFIGGPGAVLATAVLVKLFARLGQFAAGSAKELLGTNKAAQQQAAIEQSILSILQKNSQFTSQILAGKMTTVQAEKQMLDYLTAQSNILREQERLSKVIGANLAMKGVSVGASGIPMTAPAKKTKAAASGYIPNFATDMAVGQAMESAGAREHGYKAGKARKTTIHDGNGKSFKSFVNNKEDVKTFTNAAGKKATVVRPPNGFGENTQYAAGGYVPNFVKNQTSIRAGVDFEKRLNKSLKGTASFSPNAPMDFPLPEGYGADNKIKSALGISGSSIYGDAKISRSRKSEQSLLDKYLRTTEGQADFLSSKETKKGFVNLNPKGLSMLFSQSGADARGIAYTSTLNKSLSAGAQNLIKTKFGKSKKSRTLAMPYIADKINTNALSALSSGYVPNFAAGVLTGDALRGNEYKAALEYVANSNKPVRTILGPSGSGKTTRAVNLGGKIVNSFSELDGFDSYILDRASLDFPKDEKVTANLKKIFSRSSESGSLDVLMGSRSTISQLRNKRAEQGDKIVPNRAQLPTGSGGVASFIMGIRGFKSEYPQANVSRIFKSGGGYENRQVSFGSGFIPNFASMGSKFKAMYGGGTTMRAVDKEKTAKKKNLDVKKLDLSDRYTMVHGGNQGLSSADVSLEAGNKLFDAKIATAGLNTAGTNLQKYGIKGVVGDALVGATNNIIKTFGGTEQITDASSLDNAGSVGSAAGTVFETALRKAFNAPAVSQTQRIDFPAPTPELKKFFHNAPGQYEAKISRTPDNLKSTLKKWVDVNGLASSASGYIPNFAKSGLSYSYKDKDEFGFSEIQAIMSGKKVGSFSYAEDKKGLVDVGDFSVNKGERGKGIGSGLYKEAIRRNAGKKMRGQLLPQMNRLLQKIKNGEPVSAETLYPQIKRADLAKSSMFEVYGHKGMEIEKMTRDQFASFVNAKISELKKDPKKLQSYFGNVEADEYGGLGVDLQTQHSAGFIPNFADRVRKNMYDWDGTIIPTIRGNPDEYIKQLGSLKEKDLLPIGKKLKSGKKKFDILTSRPPLFEKAITETSSRLGLPVNKINFGVKPKDKIAEAGRRGSKIVDDNLDLIGKPGFLNARVVNKRLSSGFVPNFSSALNDAIAREQSSGLSKSQIYVDSNSSLKNKNNPMGLMVANRRDEPGGGIQGIKRAKKEGRNPKTYGAAAGFVPNFAVSDPGTFSALTGKAFRGDGAEIEKSRGIVEKTLKKFPSLSSEFENVAKEFEGLNSDIDNWIKKIRELNSSASKSQAPSRGGEANINASQLSGREIVFSRAGASDKEKAAAKTRDRRAEAEYKAGRAAEGEGSYQTFAMSGPGPAEASAKKNRKQRSLDYLRGGGSMLGGKAKDSMLGKGMGYLKQNSMGIGFGLQAAAGMAGEYAGNDDTQTGRGIKAGAGAFGDIASFAGTGAMIAGPYGALAGALVGAAKGAVDMHKALTTKVPDLEKALQASSDAANRFGESGQKLLMLNEQYGDALMSGNPAQAADIMVKTQQAYAEELSKLTEAQRSSMISAIAQGKGQEEYAKILGEMQNSVKAQETATQLTKFSESGGIFSGPDKKLLAGVDKGLALDFTKGMDTASITAALEKSAASLGNANLGTENQALDLMKNLASSESLTGDQKENLNKMIEAFSSAAENTDLSSVAEAFLKSIKDKPKSDADVKKAQQAAKTELEARAAKAKKEIEIREKTNAMLIKLQSDTEAVYQRYNNSMEDFISSIQTASEMMGAAGQFREEYLVQSGANKSITDPIKEKNIVNKSNADLKVGIYKSQLDTSKNFNEGVSSLLSGLEADSAKAAVGQSTKDQSSQFLEMKSKLEQALLPVQEMITSGNYEGAKSKTQEVFNNLKPEERAAIGEDKITSAVKQLESGIDQGARNQDLLVKNSQKDLAIQAQQLIFQKAMTKLTQAQNFGGTTNQILGNTEDSPFNKAIEAVTNSKIMGYNQKGLQPGSVSAVQGGDRNSLGVDGKKPSIGTAEQIVNFYKAAGEIGGESVMSTESKDFAVLTQAIREQTRKKLDELRGAGEGVVDPAVFTRLETTLATLGGGDQVAQLKLMKELGFANISGKKITDEAMKGYSGGAFAGLDPALKKGFEATSDEGASATFLLLADQQKQTASILQGQTAQTDSLNQGLENIAKAGIEQNGILAQQPSVIAQAIGAILEKGRADSKVDQSGQKIIDFNTEVDRIESVKKTNDELIKEAENKKAEAQARLSESNISEADTQDKAKLEKAGSILSRIREQYISEESKRSGSMTGDKSKSFEERRKDYLANEYDISQKLINAQKDYQVAQEQSSIIQSKTTENQGLIEKQNETKVKTSQERQVQLGLINDARTKGATAMAAQSKVLDKGGVATQAYIDKNEAARQEAAKKKALAENLGMQGGGDLATEQQKKNKARSQGRGLASPSELTRSMSGKMDTFENAAMLEFGGANNKSFDKLISQQALPSFENFASVYEQLGGKGKGREFYQQKKTELLGAEKTVTKPTTPAATVPIVTSTVSPGATAPAPAPAAVSMPKPAATNPPTPAQPVMQDPSQLISNILTTVNQIAAGLQKQDNTAAASGGQAGAGGAVSVSTPINLSINSTAGENKTEVASVADQIKNGISQFFSSPEFLERVTTIAKTAAGNPPPPKSKV